MDEYAPQIIYIKGIHNTVADAVSRLDYDPQLNKTNEYTHAMLGVEPEELSTQQWKLFAHHLCSFNDVRQASIQELAQQILARGKI